MNIKNILILFFAFLILTGCHKERGEDAELGTPFSKVEGLSAAPWIVTSVSIQDGVDPALSTRDFSPFYLSGNNKLQISFDKDGTFMVVPGDGLNFLPLEGTWTFDDEFAPRKIILTSSNGTQELQLLGPTRIVDEEFKFRFDKYKCEIDGEVIPVYSYIANFVRLN